MPFPRAGFGLERDPVTNRWTLTEYGREFADCAGIEACIAAWRLMWAADGPVAEELPAHVCEVGLP